MTHKTLILPEELQEMSRRLGDRLVLLDVTWILGRNIGGCYYERAHLPGARFLDFEDVMASKAGAMGRHPLPSKTQLEEDLSRVGVSQEHTVVFYDHGDTLAASRSALVLRHFGHKKVHTLLGGFGRWAAEGRSVSVGRFEPISTRYAFDSSSASKSFIDVAELMEGERVLIDVRDRVRYRGHHEPIDKVAGHIPNAINLPYNEVYSLQSGIDRAKIQRFCEKNRLSSDSNLITYCGSGITASFMALAFEYLGQATPLVYAGSWSEWIEDSSREVIVEP
jgi:thiosulfate/3-mercaptopyruvate sulfurtransferase